MLCTGLPDQIGQIWQLATSKGQIWQKIVSKRAKFSQMKKWPYNGQFLEENMLKTEHF